MKKNSEKKKKNKGNLKYKKNKKMRLLEGHKPKLPKHDLLWLAYTLCPIIKLKVSF